MNVSECPEPKAANVMRRQGEGDELILDYEG